MNIEIYYKYSELDKEPQFGLVITDEDIQRDRVYINWIWYYLGYYLNGSNRPTLYQFIPWSWTKIKPKKYKYCNNANRQAKLIANYMKRKCAK